MKKFLSFIAILLLLCAVVVFGFITLKNNSPKVNDWYESWGNEEPKDEEPSTDEESSPEDGPTEEETEVPTTPLLIFSNEKISIIVG